MHALAGQRVEIDRERCHERLAFAGAHLGDLAAVEHDPADHLHIVMPLTEHARSRLAHGRERLREQIVQLFALGKARAEFDRLRGELLVRQRVQRRLERADLGDDRPERFDITVVRRPEKRFGNTAEHGEFL